MASDDDYNEFLEDSANTDLWTVAWCNDKLAGFVLSYVANGRAVINEVTVLPHFRRKGLAKALMITNLKLLEKTGVTVVRLHTDAEGRAGGRQLYEKLGFKPLKIHFRLRKYFKNADRG